MASSEQFRVAVPDPNGDVNLIIGLAAGEKALRVSSKVLSLASPVFAALFSPRFSEGTALSHSTGVREIPLPDDNPEALRLICHVLHHAHPTPRKLSVGLPKEAAILCDKYDLAGPLSAWSEVWLQAWKQDAVGEDAWTKMMHISAIFNNHGVFHHSSAKFVSSCPMAGSSTVSKDWSGLSNLSNRLFVALRTKRQNTILELFETLEKPIISYKTYGRPQQESARALTINHYLGSLHQLSLWPVSIMLQTSSIESLMKTMRLYVPCTGNVIRTGCNCNNYPAKELIQDVVNQVAREQKGLCLTCVREGRIATGEGNCSAAEDHLCTGKVGS